MGPEVFVPLGLSVVTAATLATRSLLRSYGQQIVLLTRLDENVKVCLVGLESLRMIDTDTDTRVRLIEARLEDIERYLHLASSCKIEHPFVPRVATKPAD